MNTIQENEAPLVGMLPKTLSEMSEEELRAFVQEVQSLRTTVQTLNAQVAIRRAVKAEAAETKKTESLFGEF